MLTSLICCVTDASFVIHKLNNCLTKCTLFEANGFLYMLERIIIRPIFFLSFAMLKITLLDNDNWITPSTCLSRTAHFSSCIIIGFSSNRIDTDFFDIISLQSISSKN
ncbi:unnamed protein product [Musa textilis]